MIRQEILCAVLAPVADFFQAFIAGLLEKANAVPRMLKLVNIGPDFGAPAFLMGRGLATGSTAGVQTPPSPRDGRGQLDEDAAHFLDFFLFADDVFVAQNVAKTQLASFQLGFRTGVEWAILGAQLLG